MNGSNSNYPPGVSSVPGDGDPDFVDLAEKFVKNTRNANSNDTLEVSKWIIEGLLEYIDYELEVDPLVITRTTAHRIEEWADEQFPQATQLSRAHHLQKETGELIEAIAGNGDVTEEVGDCLSLLLHIITHAGIDIEAELERKLKINKSREWGEPNEKGFVEHSKSEGAL